MSALKIAVIASVVGFASPMLAHADGLPTCGNDYGVCGATNLIGKTVDYYGLFRGTHKRPYFDSSNPANGKLHAETYVATRGDFEGGLPAN